MFRVLNKTLRRTRFLFFFFGKRGKKEEDFDTLKFFRCKLFICVFSETNCTLTILEKKNSAGTHTHTHTHTQSTSYVRSSSTAQYYYIRERDASSSLEEKKKNAREVFG